MLLRPGGFGRSHDRPNRAVAEDDGSDNSRGLTALAANRATAPNGASGPRCGALVSQARRLRAPSRRL
jgi:hypothetical protein